MGLVATVLERVGLYILIYKPVSFFYSLQIISFFAHLNSIANFNILDEFGEKEIVFKLMWF